MENVPGLHFPTLWLDFMAEKLNLLEWVFSTESKSATEGVLFCDADICFLGPLLDIPETAKLAASSHQIRPHDEARFGKYNGGMLWLTSPRQIEAWRAACATSRFFEQAAIEDLVSITPFKEMYEIPRTQNYGWWRLWQGTKPAVELKSEWSVDSNILVGGEPLGSVHTHFGEKRDVATFQYNLWVLHWLQKAAITNTKAGRLLRYIMAIYGFQ